MTNSQVFDSVRLGATFDDNHVRYVRISEHYAVRLDTLTKVTFNATDRVFDVRDPQPANDLRQS